jgi:bifunctional non-homologous end joining protein LigD
LPHHVGVVTIPAPMQAPEQLRQPFTDPDWLYEIKLDGYRVMAGVEAGPPSPNTRLELATIAASRVQLRTKNGVDCSTWFPEVTEALAALPRGAHILDGEAAVLRDDGTSDFNLLQARVRKKGRYAGASQVTYCVFDILVHDGRKVMTLPLVERKALLEQLVYDIPGILFVKDLPADENLFRSITLPPPEGLGLQIEGVMAKRRDSIYEPGVRSPAWAKIKRKGWREGRKWTN